MRYFSLVLLLLFTSVSFARPIDLSFLNRQIDIQTPDGLMSLRYAAKIDGKIYYRGTEHLNVARIFENNEKSLILELISEDHDVFLSANLNEGKKIKSKVKDIKITKHLEYPNMNLTHWFEYEASELSRPYEIELKTSLYGQKDEDRIRGSVTATGPLEFYRGNGCENGDQLFVLDPKLVVNVVNLKYGAYYTHDEHKNPGLHRWFKQLMELKVPFTFRGRLHTRTPDLWEGSFWMGEGRLTVGYNTRISVVTYLNRLVAEAWESRTLPEKKSDLTPFSMTETNLRFSYKNVQVDLNLLTGEVSVKRN